MLYIDDLFPSVKSQRDGTCVCNAPCERVLYEPSLSYAQISTFNVRKMVLPRKQSQVRVFGKFMKARETLQRVSPDIIQEDNRLISKLITVMTTFIPRLNDSESVLISNSRYTKATYGVAVPNVYDVYEQTGIFIRSDFVKVVRYNKIVQVTLFDQVVESRLQSLLSFYRTVTSEFLEGQSGDMFYDWQSCIRKPKQSNCNENGRGTALYYKAEAVNDILSVNQSSILSIADDIRNDYIARISNLFLNTSHAVEENAQHSACLAHLDYINRTLYSSIGNITESLLKYSDTKSIEDKLAIAMDVYEHYQQLQTISQAKITETCAWFSFPGVTVKSLSVGYSTPLSAQTLFVLFADLKKYREDAGKIARRMNSYVLLYQEILENLNLYLSSIITKSDLHGFMRDLKINRMIVDVQTLQSAISQPSTDLMKALDDVQVLYDGLFARMTSYSLPVLDDDIIAGMPLIQFAYTQVENEVVESHLSRMRENREGCVIAVHKRIFAIQYNYTRDALSALEDFGTKFVLAMEELQRYLKEFDDENKMDDSFFMYVKPLFPSC